MKIEDISLERYRAICRRKGTTGLTMWILYQLMLKENK